MVVDGNDGHAGGRGDGSSATEKTKKTSPRNLTAGKLRRREGKKTRAGVDDEEQGRAFIGFDECTVSSRNRRARMGRTVMVRREEIATDPS